MSLISAEGRPFPLGISRISGEDTLNFSLYSKHARLVTLVFFGESDFYQPLAEVPFDPRHHKSGPIWHAQLRPPGEASYYAYRVDGPDPADGFEQHHFDSEKLLLDPYATHVFFPPDFSREAASLPGSNFGRAPLAFLHHHSCEALETQEKSIPLHDEEELIIYELHVRGFTYHLSAGVSEEKRGTFSGVIEKIPHLLDLGITAVELMPVFQFDPDENNYWGYMPLNFFAPHNGYCMSEHLCDQFVEFRAMVDALHQVNIEVFLDVVYNHTTEATHTGPTYSFRGIDASSYYVMNGDPECPYADFTGTGNTLHTQNRAVRKLIIDSLLHWGDRGGVDGFRFDLASIFTRQADGSVSPNNAPIFAEISSRMGLASKRLIAEPWDATGLSQLGHRFPGTLWMQWNANYRNTLQKAVRGDHGMIPELMTRLYGSADLFPDTVMEACHPYQSINFVTCHDGFTLYDLVSYHEKNNWANGFNNEDGPEDFSYDYESPVLKQQQARNLICLLMLSNGVPMFRMGDEFLNSQNGNSNPYNQDNETSWLDWQDLETNRTFFQFVRHMIAFRKSHPSISRSRFWREDLRWYGQEHQADLSHDSHQVAYCLHGETDLYVMINLGIDDCQFGLHEGVPSQWQVAIDTANPGRVEPVGEVPFLTVKARSVIVLERLSSTLSPESRGRHPGELVEAAVELRQ